MITGWVITRRQTRSGEPERGESCPPRGVRAGDTKGAPADADIHVWRPGQVAFFQAAPRADGVLEVEADRVHLSHERRELVPISHVPVDGCSLLLQDCS